MSPEPETQTGGTLDLPEVRRAGTPAIVLAAAVLALALAGLFVLGWLPRHRQAKLAREDAAELADGIPTLAVAQVRETTGEGSVTLSCEVRAEQEALIRTRATGYLKSLHADMGDQVEAGKLLAEIDAPEIESELLRGRAAVEQAQATLAKATTAFEQAERSLQRYQRLGHGVASGLSVITMLETTAVASGCASTMACTALR